MKSTAGMAGAIGVAGVAGTNVTFPLASVVSGARDVHKTPPRTPIVPELPLPPFGV
jgi:hypothetical protein